MMAIDLIGLFFTVLLTGLRYPHYAVIAAVIHDISRIMTVLILNGHLEKVVAAGAFGTTIASNLKGTLPALILVYSGPAANFIAGMLSANGLPSKKSQLFNPAEQVQNPFAIVNFRLAIVSFLINSWLLMS